MRIPIAIVDSGICHNLFLLPDEIREHDFSQAHVTRGLHTYHQISLHGTIVSAIVQKYAPSISLHSIQVFKAGLLCSTPKSLIRALKWCLKERIPIINLSLGTVEQADFRDLGKVVDQLVENNQIVVSAYHVSGVHTMPAIHPGVLGVYLDEALENNDYYSAGGGTTRDFFASSRHHLLTQKKIEFVTPLNTSYAAPTITSAIVNCLIAHPGKSMDYIIECVKADGIR